MNYESSTYNDFLIGWVRIKGTYLAISAPQDTPLFPRLESRL